MRIQKISVDNYRVLQNFTLEIDGQERAELSKTYKIDLIVGVNGTGKSTLIHLLAELFQRLANPYQPPLFTFSLTYTLQSGMDQTQTITISNDDEKRREALAEGQTLEQAEQYYCQLDQAPATLVPTIEKQYLPNYVVVFSSGNQNGWELDETWANEIGSSVKIPEPDDPAAADKLITLYQQEMAASTQSQTATSQRETISDDRFLFIKNNHLPLIILCGLLADMRYKNSEQQTESILDDALQETRIKALHGFSLRFSKQAATEAGDADLIQQLSELATYTVRYDPDGNEQLLFFELFTDEEQPCIDTDRIQQLLDLRGGLALEFFRALNRLCQPESAGTEPLLQDIHLFFDRSKKSDQNNDQANMIVSMEEREPLHRLDWLSDGELSFLGRLSLFSLLRDSEALVLLDEPEVHFNDYWKHQLVARLDRSLRNSYSHVIMTTHSSITLSDVFQTDIHVLKRNGTFTDHAEPPNLNTLGTDPSDIIMSVFGAESATGAYGTEYIQQQIREIRDFKSAQERYGRFTTLAKNIGPGPLRYLVYRERLAAENELNS
jgi:Predicted ATPase